MGDIIDKANNGYQKWLDMQIAKRRATAKPKPNPISECVDCGEDIGTARKQAVPHAIRCTPCQASFEFKRG